MTRSTQTTMTMSYTSYLTMQAIITSQPTSQVSVDTVVNQLKLIFIRRPINNLFNLQLHCSHLLLV